MKIMLSGYTGKMGRAIIEAVDGDRDMEIVAGSAIDPAPINLSFPGFFKLSDYSGELDIIIDFSHHSMTESLLRYAEQRGAPLVIATTGHTEDELALIGAAAAKIAVFKSANMSVGVNLVAELAKKAAALLRGSFDIEIIEKHHGQKLDAPSGTALLIADGINESGEYEYIYDRHSVRKTRGKREIGMHAVRGGTIIGEHEIIFAGTNELISISHSAQSREMFAAGALAAARFIADKPPGLYSMKNLINI